MNRIEQRPDRQVVTVVKVVKQTARVGLVAAIATVVLATRSPGRALAQTFEKFDESARDQLPASPFVAGAYAFIWLALLTYVIVLARGLNRAHKDIQSLRRRIEERGGAAPQR